MGAFLYSKHCPEKRNAGDSRASKVQLSPASKCVQILFQLKVYRHTILHSYLNFALNEGQEVFYSLGHDIVLRVIYPLFREELLFICHLRSVGGLNGYNVGNITETLEVYHLACLACKSTLNALTADELGFVDIGLGADM